VRERGPAPEGAVPPSLAAELPSPPLAGNGAEEASEASPLTGVAAALERPAPLVSPPPAPPAPSPRFVRYAESIRVSGVFQGSPSRALIDGRIVRAGDLLDPALGIKFVAVDADTKHLILEEPSGARMRVKY
jgi:hypothetical protein